MLSPESGFGQFLGMRVAHIFMSMPVGGAEDLVALLARHRTPGQEIRLVCLREPGTVGLELAASGYPLECLPWVHRKRPAPMAYFKLARWLRRERIALVHSHVYNSHVYAGWAARLAGIPFVLHHHKTHAGMRWRRRWVMKALARRAAAHLTLSDQTARDVAEAYAVPSGRIHALPNPVDRGTFHPHPEPGRLRKELGLDGHGPWIGTAASLTPPKNHPLNLEMLRQAEAQGFTGRFLLLGGGRDETALRQRASEMGLRSLTFMGPRRPLAPWLQSLDVFVLASAWEGQPMVLLQAMACGLPVIASRIEGNVDVLGPGHPGLFPLEDAAAYAGMVRDACTRADFRAALLSHQEQRLAGWPDTAAYTARLARVYASILAQPRI